MSTSSLQRTISPGHVFKVIGLRQSVGGEIDELFFSFPVFLKKLFVSRLLRYLVAYFKQLSFILIFHTVQIYRKLLSLAWRVERWRGTHRRARPNSNKTRCPPRYALATAQLSWACVASAMWWRHEHFSKNGLWRNAAEKALALEVVLHLETEHLDLRQLHEQLTKTVTVDWTAVVH